MPDEERNPRITEIVDEMKALLQEFSGLTENEYAESGTNGVVTAAVLGFECGRFDNEGDMVYRTDKIVFPGTSYSAAIGIIKETEWLIHHNSFGHCHGGVL